MASKGGRRCEGLAVPWPFKARVQDLQAGPLETKGIFFFFLQKNSGSYANILEKT